MTSTMIGTAPIEARPPPIAQRLFPVLGWLPGYRRAWLLPDVLAGLAVWAVMVPEGMAYAGIVGVPPIMGLYTVSELKCAVPCTAIAPTVSAEIRPVAVSGPTTSKREVPSSA